MYTGGQKSVRRLSVVWGHSITTWTRRGEVGVSRMSTKVHSRGEVVKIGPQSC